MHRPVKDIIESQIRIGWSDANTRKKYRIHNKYFEENDPVCVKKNKVWEAYQKNIIEHKIEMQYNDLQDHPLWVEKEERVGWKAHQVTKIGA